MFAITLVLSLLLAVFADARAFGGFGLPVLDAPSSSFALPGSTADSAPAQTTTAAPAIIDLITTVIPQTTIESTVVGYWNTRCNNTHFREYHSNESMSNTVVDARKHRHWNWSLRLRLRWTHTSSHRRVTCLTTLIPSPVGSADQFCEYFQRC